MHFNRNRVVVTGLGWVTPLGGEIEATWKHLLAGRSGVGRTTRFEASTFPTTFSAESYADDFGVVNDSEPESGSIVTQFAMSAACQAWSMSRLDFESNDSSHDDLGIYFAAGETCLPFELLRKYMNAAWGNGQRSFDAKAWIEILHELDSHRIQQLYPQHTLQILAQTLGAGGYVSNCLTACAAGLQAIGEATELIRLGEAQVMIAGGANSMLHPIGVSSFNRLGTLSTRNDNPATASRPFDIDRDGFVLGEGAGAVVLESLQHATSRGAPILAEVVGYGSTSDAYRVTDQHPESDGLVRAMENALHDAQLTTRDIDYLNAHGTSTKENDKQETLAIRKVFGPCHPTLPVSSIKSMIGHLLTAAGAVEFIATVLALRDKQLPPTVNLSAIDPECNLNHITSQFNHRRLKVAMTVNTGFGGLNDAIIIKRLNEGDTD